MCLDLARRSPDVFEVLTVENSHHAGTEHNTCKYIKRELSLCVPITAEPDHQCDGDGWFGPTMCACIPLTSD